MALQSIVLLVLWALTTPAGAYTTGDCVKGINRMAGYYGVVRSISSSSTYSITIMWKTSGSSTTYTYSYSLSTQLDNVHKDPVTNPVGTPCCESPLKTYLKPSIQKCGLKKRSVEDITGRPFTGSCSDQQAEADAFDILNGVRNGRDMLSLSPHDGLTSQARGDVDYAVDANAPLHKYSDDELCKLGQRLGLEPSYKVKQTFFDIRVSGDPSIVPNDFLANILAQTGDERWLYCTGLQIGLAVRSWPSELDRERLVGELFYTVPNTEKSPTGTKNYKNALLTDGSIVDAVLAEINADRASSSLGEVTKSPKLQGFAHSDVTKAVQNHAGVVEQLPPAALHSLATQIGRSDLVVLQLTIDIEVDDPSDDSSIVNSLVQTITSGVVAGALSADEVLVGLSVRSLPNEQQRGRIVGELLYTLTAKP